MLGLKHAVRHGGALRLESMRYARHECTECAEIRHAGRQSGARRSVRGDLRAWDIQRMTSAKVYECEREVKVPEGVRRPSISEHAEHCGCRRHVGGSH